MGSFEVFPFEQMLVAHFSTINDKIQKLRRRKKEISKKIDWNWQHNNNSEIYRWNKNKIERKKIQKQAIWARDTKRIEKKMFHSTNDEEKRRSTKTISSILSLLTSPSYAYVFMTITLSTHFFIIIVSLVRCVFMYQILFNYYLFEKGCIS